MPPKPKFTESEKVLCFHGPLLYEAKCVKSRRDPQAKGEFQFFVHYQGWNKNWDEWVPESRILKINPENLDKKDKLLHNHQANVKEKKKSAKNAKPSGGSGSGSNTPQGGGGGTGLGGSLGGLGLGLGGPGSVGSRSNNTSRASTPVSDRASKGGGSKRTLADDERSTSSWEDETPLSSGTRRSAAAAAKKARGGVAGDEGSEDALANRKVQIELPEELKYVLVSDWDLVTHKRQIFQLPAKVPVSAITADFLRHVEKGGQNRTGVHSEIVLGLKDVFNDMLGLCLLYKSERKQFETLMKGDKSPFELYGSPHLLRFMVKLGPYLKLTNIHREPDMRTIEGVLKEFLAYLEAHRPKYFSSKNYVDATEG
ncbi:hypothetical protein TCAL_11353 [Tigriopus californicus]|uniref:Chromo domain-containing protein n=1 Tax=Tigriopus californicus TaxID=6832 RepID=A0A553PFA5_TIGCA|nr:mortality factor 4-like protein 1 [Tigriopus californicus]TRY76368.1 hypothetical protein TCAL_11353 [Tigriopus californicus]